MYKNLEKLLIVNKLHIEKHLVDQPKMSIVLMHHHNSLYLPSSEPTLVKQSANILDFWNY